MKFLNFNKILCLSPHPDDVEYGMLGTILKYVDTEFHILSLTNGGKYDITVEGDSRLKEIKEVWSSAELSNAKIYFTEHQHFSATQEDGWINLIEKRYTKKNNYDAIMLPSINDSHFEHRYVSGFGPALCRVSSISLIEYATPSALQEWSPNLYVDIKKVYKTKKDLLKKFTSQQKRSYFSDSTINGFHTDFQCSKKGLSVVEKFRIVSAYVTEV